MKHSDYQPFRVRAIIFSAIVVFTFAAFSGFCQKQDSVSLKSKWYRSKPAKVLIAPALLTTGSLLLFDPAGGEHTVIGNIPGFHTNVDDYLQYVPIAIVYGLDIAGVKARNDLLNRSIMLVKAETLMALLVVALKSTVEVPRPDGSGYNSFPSGHTAQAFVAATFMHKEYGHLSVWYSVGAYAVATTTGLLRIFNNRHRLTDVLMGAGIGIFATNLAYATHRYKWGKKRKRLSLLPTYNLGTYGVYLQWSL